MHSHAPLIVLAATAASCQTNRYEAACDAAADCDKIVSPHCVEELQADERRANDAGCGAEFEALFQCVEAYDGCADFRPLPIGHEDSWACSRESGLVEACMPQSG